MEERGHSKLRVQQEPRQGGRKNIQYGARSIWRWWRVWSGRWPRWSWRRAQTKAQYASLLNVVGMNGLGSWRVRTGGLKDSDRTEGGDPRLDKKNPEEWVPVNFKSWLHHFLRASGRLPTFLNMNVLIS